MKTTNRVSSVTTRPRRSLISLLMLTATATAFTAKPINQANTDDLVGRLPNCSFKKQDVMVTSNIEGLVGRALEVLERSAQQQQVFIGIAGAPGSGKTSLAQKVADGINKAKEGYTCFSIVLPMDGYHISQAQLQAMGELGQLIGDADGSVGKTTTFDDLMRRRGAPWTFDPEALFQDLRAAKVAHFGAFPLYDRMISDPVPDQIHVTKEHRIVLCEGNYLLAFDDPAWEPLKAIWDDAWLIDVPEAILKERLVGRHLRTWTAVKEARFGKGRRGAEAKTESSDLKHARWIYRTSRSHANLIIRNDN